MSITITDNATAKIIERTKSAFINCDLALQGNYQVTVIRELVTYVNDVIVKTEELPPKIILLSDANVFDATLLPKITACFDHFCQ